MNFLVKSLTFLGSIFFFLCSFGLLGFFVSDRSALGIFSSLLIALVSFIINPLVKKNIKNAYLDKKRFWIIVFIFATSSLFACRVLSMYDDNYYADHKENILKEIDEKINNKSFYEAEKIVNKYHPYDAVILGKKLQVIEVKRLEKSLEETPKNDIKERGRILQRLIELLPDNKKYQVLLSSIKKSLERIEEKELERKRRKEQLEEKEKICRDNIIHADVYLRMHILVPSSYQKESSECYYKKDKGTLVEIQYLAKNVLGVELRKTATFLVTLNGIVIPYTLK